MMDSAFGFEDRRRRGWSLLAAAGGVAAVVLALGAPVAAQSISSGTTRDLDHYRKLYNSEPAAGVRLQDIVGIGIAGSDDHIYVWYRDGTVGSGSTKDLDEYRERRPYAMPPGRLPDDIVGMAIAKSNDWVYAWYRDGTVSAGSSTDLAAHKQPYPYKLPPGKDPLMIVGMGIAKSGDRVFTWFDDGTVSSGNSGDLDAVTPPQSVRMPPGKSARDIIEMGIAGSDDHVYAWFGSCGPAMNERLNLGNIPQQTNQWCWAASAQMIMRYVGNQNIAQCVQANNRFGRTDCCKTPTPVACVNPGWPEFQKYGFTSHQGGALSWANLRRQIATSGSCRGRPLAFSWGWLSFDASGKLQPVGSGHMMVAMGYQENNNGQFVEIQDPWPPFVGDFRIDTYGFYVQDPSDHVHWTDYYDVRYTGGK
jgi:hypothetical protein